MARSRDIPSDRPVCNNASFGPFMNIDPPLAVYRTRPELMAPAGDWDCHGRPSRTGPMRSISGYRAASTRGAGGELRPLGIARAPGISARPRRERVLDAQHARLPRRAGAGRASGPGRDQRRHRCRAGAGPRHGPAALGAVSRSAAARLDPNDAQQAECIAQVESLGIRRVVLPRELSIDQIAAIRRQTSVELEAFVHGGTVHQLFRAMSGQFGARWANTNRGQCAQPCRPAPTKLVIKPRPAVAPTKPRPVVAPRRGWHALKGRGAPPMARPPVAALCTR